LLDDGCGKYGKMQRDSMASPYWTLAWKTGAKDTASERQLIEEAKDGLGALMVMQQYVCTY